TLCPLWFKLLPARDLYRPVKHLDFGGFFFRAAFKPVFVGSSDKRSEQRMRLEWFRLEFRMELASDEMGMIWQFDHLDVGAVGRRSGNPQTTCSELLLIL